MVADPTVAVVAMAAQSAIRMIRAETFCPVSLLEARSFVMAQRAVIPITFSHR